MDSAAIAEFFKYLKYQRLVTDYVHVGAMALMIWDLILTLSREIRLIWFSPWSYMKLLFLSTKYITIVTLSCALYLQITVSDSVTLCMSLYQAVVWLLVIKIVIAESILGVRTWAVWRRSVKVGVSLLVMMTANLIVQFVFLMRFKKSATWIPAPYPNFKGCLVSASSRIPVIQSAAFAVYDLYVLGLMISSAVISHRMSNMHELSIIVYRDGILFYAFFFLMKIVNLICILVLPVELIKLLPPIEDVLYSILVRRTILDIRDVCERSTHSTTMRELDEQGISMDLVFKPSDSSSTPVHSTTWTENKHDVESSSHREDPALIASRY